MDPVGLLFIVVWLGFAVLSGAIAQSKGYSFGAFLLFGAVAWVLALIVVSILPDRIGAIAVGQVVKTRDVVDLNDGGRIPSDHLSKVAALDVIDGHVVVQIEAPDGSSHWVARSGVLPA